MTNRQISPVVPLQYARAATTSAPRGKRALLISIGAMVPAAFVLWAVSSGPYIDPFALLVLTPVWLLAVGLGIAATALLVEAARKPRPRGPGSDMLKQAVATNIGFWVLLALPILVVMAG